jgi:hypothetical protein
LKVLVTGGSAFIAGCSAMVMKCIQRCDAKLQIGILQICLPRQIQGFSSRGPMARYFAKSIEREYRAAWADDHQGGWLKTPNSTDDVFDPADGRAQTTVFLTVPDICG